jgi:hypothetical protein
MTANADKARLGSFAPNCTDVRDAIVGEGLEVLSGVLSRQAADVIRTELELALSRSHDGPIRGDRQQIAASRNVMRLWPGVLELARQAVIRDVVVAVLGDNCGLVRALYFDKPPGRSWALPWHKDMTIAVREHRPLGGQFCKPTMKAGVPHVEASERVLREMLIARLHLDDVDESNGPLLVVPGSHQEGKKCAAEVGGKPIRPVFVQAGDVLLMRPLVTHCSRGSQPGTLRHRRILHLEFASATPLPDGYEWYEFHPIQGAPL